MKENDIKSPFWHLGRLEGLSSHKDSENHARFIADYIRGQQDRIKELEAQLLNLSNSTGLTKPTEAEIEAAAKVRGK